MIKVVLIEDDPMVQEVNRQFISRVQGFKLVGTASNGQDGMELIKEIKPDLVLIDVYMPILDGRETINRLRSEQISIDVIAITAASDIDTVRSFLQNGAFDYIVKPFKFERLQKALENYRTFHRKIRHLENISQKELDSLIFSMPREENLQLPKGLHEVTLNRIFSFLSELIGSASAEEVADGVGIARVTARRYLEYLERAGKISLDVTYGGIGRPINRYSVGEKDKS